MPQPGKDRVTSFWELSRAPQNTGNTPTTSERGALVPGSRGDDGTCAVSQAHNGASSVLLPHSPRMRGPGYGTSSSPSQETSQQTGATPGCQECWRLRSCSDAEIHCETVHEDFIGSSPPSLQSHHKLSLGKGAALGGRIRMSLVANSHLL